MTLSSMVTLLKTGSCLGVLLLSVENKERAGKAPEQHPATLHNQPGGQLDADLPDAATCYFLRAL